MTESTHRLTFQLTVDDAELDRQRDAYITANPDDADLVGFYGEPAEWSSLLDLVDAQEAAVILRSEITAAAHDVAPFDPYKRPKPNPWRRLLKTIGVGVLLMLALSSAASARTIVGTAGNDYLVGTGGLDYIRGLAGADVLRGLAGNDDLEGGRGHDRLRGHAGDDYLWGGPGRDVVAGGGGYDVCWGGRGGDLFLYCEFLVDFCRRCGDEAGGVGLVAVGRRR